LISSRADEAYRALRKFQTKESHVAKLVRILRRQHPSVKPELTTVQFAKHFKVEEQTKMLQSTRTGIAVGTPARLMALVDNGVSSFNRE